MIFFMSDNLNFAFENSPELFVANHVSISAIEIKERFRPKNATFAIRSWNSFNKIKGNNNKKYYKNKKVSNKSECTYLIIDECSNGWKFHIF